MGNENCCLTCRYFAPLLAVPVGPKAVEPIAGFCMRELEMLRSYQEDPESFDSPQPLPVFARAIGGGCWKDRPTVIPAGGIADRSVIQ